MAKEEGEGGPVEGDEAKEISTCQIASIGRVRSGEMAGEVALAKKLAFFALSYGEALQESYR